jgi:hypothetical protein
VKKPVSKFAFQVHNLQRYIEEAAAVNAAMHHAAASMIGQPLLQSLLDWCEGDDVAGLALFTALFCSQNTR